MVHVFHQTVMCSIFSTILQHICSYCSHMCLLAFNMSAKRKLSSYSLAQKYVLMLLERGERVTKIAKDLNIPKNSISTWSKAENKTKIIREYESGNYDSKRKRMRDSKYEDIEAALIQWFEEVRSRPNPPPIDGRTLKAQAERYI